MQSSRVLDTVKSDIFLTLLFCLFSVTIVSGILMFLLFVSELNYYLTTEVRCKNIWYKSLCKIKTQNSFIDYNYTFASRCSVAKLPAWLV